MVALTANASLWDEKRDVADFSERGTESTRKDFVQNALFVTIFGYKEARACRPPVKCSLNTMTGLVEAPPHEQLMLSCNFILQRQQRQR